MGAIANLSDLISKATGGSSGAPEMVTFERLDRVAGAAPATPVVGRYTHLWQYDGRPGAGAAPGAVAVPTNATAGSMFQTNPAALKQRWLTYAWAACNTSGALLFYDRLLHISGLSGTVITAQTVGGTLTRYAAAGTCIGNEIWLDVYTQIGASTTSFTVSYQNQANATKTSPAVVIGNTGFREAQRSIPVPLASGDTGVLAVNSVTILATTGTAGDFGITVRRQLTTLGFAAAAVAQMVSLLDAPVEIASSACIETLLLANQATAPAIVGGLFMVDA